MERGNSKENLIKVVAAVIINDEREEVLVAKRAKNASYPGKWEFIGGKVRAGESPEEALRREMKEEVDIRVHVGRLLGFAEADYRNRGRASHRILFYSASISDGEIKLDERIHQEIRWVTVTGLQALDFVAGDKKFAKRLAVSLAGTRGSVVEHRPERS